MTENGIVVGYDGSACAEQAIAWAAREARSRQSVLTVCLVQAPGYPSSPGPSDQDSSSRQAAEAALAPGVKLAAALAGDGEVRPLLAAGSPAGELCGLAADADMLVVGCRGRGGLPGLPVGSVSLRVAAAARGRVVVVGGDWRSVPTAPRPVVVGSDGSPESGPAVTFAFEEAVLREADLLAVCALADDRAQFGTAGQIRGDFENLIASQQEEHPDVLVRRQVSQGSARAALREAGAQAQMVVVGARGRGGIDGLPLGSVGLTVLSSATSPVGVVHHEDSP